MASRRAAILSRLHVLLLVDPAFFDTSARHFLKATDDTESERSVLEALETLQHRVSVLAFQPYRKGCRTISDDIIRLNPDIVFNFIEEVDGNRRLAGNVPALLDTLDIPYTGVSPLGMIALDKAASKLMVNSVGFPVPSFAVLPSTSQAPQRMVEFPAIVKPQFGGASECLTSGSIVHSAREMIAQARRIHRTLAQPAICERYIDGRELSVGLIEDGSGVIVLPIRETVFGSAQSGGPRFCTERVKNSANYRDRWDIRYEHAQLPAKLDRRIRSLCKRAFRVLDLSGYARIDLRLDPVGNPVFLEANANPDLSPRYFGIMGSWMDLSYEEMISKVLQTGLNRKSLPRQ